MVFLLYQNEMTTFAKYKEMNQKILKKKADEAYGALVNIDARTGLLKGYCLNPDCVKVRDMFNEYVRLFFGPMVVRLNLANTQYNIQSLLNFFKQQAAYSCKFTIEPHKPLSKCCFVGHEKISNSNKISQYFNEKEYNNTIEELCQKARPLNFKWAAQKGLKFKNFKEFKEQSIKWFEANDYTLTEKHRYSGIDVQEAAFNLLEDNS